MDAIFFLRWWRVAFQNHVGRNFAITSRAKQTVREIFNNDGLPLGDTINRAASFILTDDDEWLTDDKKTIQNFYNRIGPLEPFTESDQHSSKKYAIENGILPENWGVDFGPWLNKQESILGLTPLT